MLPAGSPYYARKIALWLGLSAAFVSCYVSPKFPVLGYENNEAACQDGQDNDKDSLIDCDDPDCITLSTRCGQRFPNTFIHGLEVTPVLCHDQIDNDEDGQYDCLDRNCQDVMEACCVREFTTELCNDGLDNDGNGFTDCGDFGCQRGLYVDTNLCTERDDAKCSDGKDNDADKFVDCADSDCATVASCLPKVAKGAEDTLAACSDGGDNDGNSFIDCNDFSCSKSKEPWPGHDGKTLADFCAQLPAKPTENTIANCSDKLDNDGNKYIDCNDFSCSQSTEPWAAQPGMTVADYCVSLSENTMAKCTDGKDNNGDNYIDCADYGCSNVTKGAPQEVADFCAAKAEGTFAKCTDHLDNDDDGYIDCADNSCREATDVKVRQACQESLGDELGDANTKCSDGLDNDGDKATDCDDWDCSWNPQVTVCANKPKICAP